MANSFITSHSQPQEEPEISVSKPKTDTKLKIKNWKTTGIGLLLSFSGFVAFSPSTFGGEQAPLVQICKYITTGGLGVLGVCSKDFNITGGDREK